MDENGATEGLSSPKKVVAGAALGVAVPAAVAVAKKLIGGQGDDGEHDGAASNEPISRERKHTKQQRPRAGGGTRTRARTREELYKQATRLKIEGRSSMNKAQLERAVNRAKQKAR
jgi:hypothetical protein